MKTKKLMMMLAAVLLSVGAFSQSGNGEPLKGDVNGDDVVDVADVVAVLQIMKEGEGIGERQYYVSIGTTPVTASNYKIVNNATQVAVSSYESQYEFTPEGTEFVYVLVGGDYWVSTITDQASNTAVDFSVVADVEISGYTVYKTNNKISGKILVNIEHVKYYWYVGQTDPSNMTSISPIVENNSSLPGWRLIGTTLPNYSSSNRLWNGGSDGTDIAFGSNNTYYLALPSNSIKLYSVGTDLTNDTLNSSGNVTINGVTYSIYTSKSTNRYFRYDLY